MTAANLAAAAHGRRAGMRRRNPTPRQGGGDVCPPPLRILRRCADDSPDNRAAADPYPVRATQRRRRSLSRQADGRRCRGGVGRRVPRRPREGPRRRRRPAGGRRVARIRAPPGRRALQRRPLGGRLRRRPDRALGVHDPRLDRRLRHLARRVAAQARGGRDGARERDQRGRDPARGGRPARRRPRPAADRARPPDPRRRRDPRGGQARRGDGHGALRRRRAPRRAPRAERARPVAGARGRPGAGPLRRLVRALPALLGWAQGRAGAAAAAGRAGLRRHLPAADPPDRADEPQGAQQHARRGARRSRLALRHRLGDGRARRRPPRAGHARGRARAVRGRGRARARHRARPRDQRLGQSPVAQGAPRVVPPPARRHDQVRREPAQEVPGHLQRQLGHAPTGGRCGTSCCGSRSCGSSSA